MHQINTGEVNITEDEYDLSLYVNIFIILCLYSADILGSDQKWSTIFPT